MNANVNTHYICPICQQPLQQLEKAFRCVQNHSFDRHKKGYVNLLLSQHKNSKMPGDSSEMVKGRREFLRAGHYQAFADAVVELVSKNITLSATNLSVLDAGCGEGFYTEQIQHKLNSNQVYGLDISKPAITAAANDKNIHWCVASSSRPPFATNSFDLIISLFSRVEHDAFLRILKPGGYVLYAGPGNNHLHSLRNIIYDQVNTYTAEKHHQYFNNDFNLIEEQSLQVPLLFNKHDSIIQLVKMTPHAHRIPQSGYERLKKVEFLKDTGDFKLYLYQLIKY